MTVLVYGGYSLEAVRGGYTSKIDGKVIKFDTPSMWKAYIDYLKKQ